MHFAFILRDIIGLIQFENGQGIHVRADGDNLPALAYFCHDACLANSALDSVSHLFQFIGNDSRRAKNVKAGFGVHVKIAPPFDEFF